MPHSHPFDIFFPGQPTPARNDISKSKPWPHETRGYRLYPIKGGEFNDKCETAKRLRDSPAFTPSTFFTYYKPIGFDDP